MNPCRIILIQENSAWPLISPKSQRICCFKSYVYLIFHLILRQDFFTGLLIVYMNSEYYRMLSFSLLSISSNGFELSGWLVIFSQTHVWWYKLIGFRKRMLVGGPDGATWCFVQDTLSFLALGTDVWLFHSPCFHSFPTLCFTGFLIVVVLFFSFPWLLLALFALTTSALFV